MGEATLEYVRLGRAGVKVSRLCLGCMNFGWRTDEDESIRIIHRALDAGVNFLDTANVYGNRGGSETIVGKALKGRRDQVVLATKVFGEMGSGPNDRGTSRRHIMQQVEASLRRLQTEWIDLYQLHRPDPDTPMDETLSALDDLVRQGKVRYIGTSTFPAWQLVQMLWISDRMGFERIVSEQPPYSIFDRRVETELLPACQAHGIGVIPWSPLAGGWLAGRYRRGAPIPEDARASDPNRRKWMGLDDEKAERRYDAVEEIEKLAKQRGVTISQFALAWVMAHPAVTAPIIGPRTLDQLEDNLRAAEIQLSGEEKEQVDRVVPPGTSLL
ncbi:MAG: aldo/keto reductase [Limnochordaceae bacterium]|nr:aldo/keto reductase [Limnochordaceae bacterium]